MLAAQRWFSPTIRMWQRGALGDAPLVVVGTRDAHPQTENGLYLVTVPFAAEEVLGLVRSLAGQTERRTVPRTDPHPEPGSRGPQVPG